MAQKKGLTREEIEITLLNFHGSEAFFRVYPKLIITEGVQYLCESAQCFWLLDAIWSYQMLKEVRNQYFQVINLSVDLEKRKGTIVVTDGNENEIHRQELDYTDFPLPSIRLYYTDDTVLLPKEY